MIELTRNQEAILEFIEMFTAENHRPPTIREFVDNFWLSWERMLEMAGDLDVLARQGYIGHNEWDKPILLRNKHGKRVKLTFVEVEEQ